MGKKPTKRNIIERAESHISLQTLCAPHHLASSKEAELSINRYIERFAEKYKLTPKETRGLYDYYHSKRREIGC